MYEFPLFGFRVRVGPMFLLLLGVNALFLMGRGPLYVVGFLVAIVIGVLVHELGHAVVARAFRLQVGAIELTGLGGQVTHARTTPGRQLLISLAGPGAGFLLALAVVPVVLLELPPEIEGAIVEPILWVSVVYGVFNLLPLLPLDGGNALLSALQAFVPRARAEVICGVVGTVGGGLLVAQAFAVGMPLTGFVGLMIVQVNFAILQHHWGQR